MQLHIHKKPNTERGFTVIELMIATMVFSVILTILVAGVLAFTNRYYKGVHASTTQNTASAILDTITQAIQFGSAAVTTTVDTGGDFFCAGGNVFVFKQGTMFTGDTSTQVGLYVMPAALCPASAPSGASLTGGQQLLGDRMRITKLTVQPAAVGTDLYDVSVVVAYGGTELLCKPSLGCADADTYVDSSFVDTNDVTCRAGSGSQYCAVSKLTASVQKRIH